MTEAKLLKRVQDVPRTSSRLLRGLREQILGGADPLGEAFCALRSPVRRRQVGSFYTPSTLIQPMIKWLLDRKPTRIVDPGAGSGRFTQAILLSNRSLKTVAVDLDAVATLMTRAMLHVIKAKSAIVQHSDYMRLRLDRIDGRTGFIGNPPYVRHHGLSTHAKERAIRLATRLGLHMSGLAGLYTHFFLQTASLVTDGDVGCFVTSAEWLDVNYGSVVRKLMLNQLGCAGVHLIAPQAIAFKDAMTTAAIAYFEVGVEHKRLTFSVSKNVKVSKGLGRSGNRVSRSELDAERWSPLLNQRIHLSEDAVPLGSIVRVSRGQVTGANSFFIMTLERARALGIEKWCKPAITSAKEIIQCAGVIRDNGQRLVLFDPPTDINRKADKALDEYLCQGEHSLAGKAPVSERYVTRGRPAWWAVRPSAPPIVASYMARQAPVFALNPDGLVTVNVVHGLWPKLPLHKDELQRLTEHLNRARASFVGRGRTYFGGLEKFEPREMEALPVLRGLLPA